MATYFEIKLGNEPLQIINFSFYDNKIRLRVYFNEIAQNWFADISEPTRDEIIVKGLPLVCGVDLLDRSTTPYFFRVADNSANGLDPSQIDDWLRRCSLLIALKEV